MQTANRFGFRAPSQTYIVRHLASFGGQPLRLATWWTGGSEESRIVEHTASSLFQCPFTLSLADKAFT